jgi:hypothetical protein
MWRDVGVKKGENRVIVEIAEPPAVPASGKIFDAAPAPTLLNSKPTLSKPTTTKIS